MNYFYNYYSMELLKNHIMNDPINDWFNIQNYLNNKFNKDNEYFKNYLIENSRTYKRDIISKIITKYKNYYNEAIDSNININQTIEHIKNNKPLIINPILHNFKYNIIVSCDLIIKKHLFIKIFDKINNINLNNIQKNDYIIINIIPETCNFKSNMKTICNNDIILFNKCCLYVFNSALKQYIYRNDIGFFICKDYKYKNNILDKKENIALIIFDKFIINKVINSLNWIKRLKKNVYVTNFENDLPCIELYPNMNNKLSEWENEKKKIAYKIKEITLVWRISYEDRCFLLNRGIKTWDNIYLLNNLYDLKDNNIKNIQEQIIHINTQNDILINPRKNISQKFKDILKIHENEFIFDIESLINLEEKTSYFDNIIKKDHPHICIIGNIYLKDNNFNYFKDFTINKLDIDEEKNIILNWIQNLNNKNLDVIYLYHWGHAEKTYIDYIKKKYPEIVFPNIILIDLLSYFKNEPIIIKDAFNFSLKTIGKCLYKYKFIDTTWSETDNGMDAMIKFKEISLNNKKNIPLKRYNEISNIIEYNKIDCIIVMEILQFLRKQYL